MSLWRIIAMSNNIASEKECGFWRTAAIRHDVSIPPARAAEPLSSGQHMLNIIYSDGARKETTRGQQNAGVEGCQRITVVYRRWQQGGPQGGRLDESERVVGREGKSTFQVIERQE